MTEIASPDDRPRHIHPPSAHPDHESATANNENTITSSTPGLAEEFATDDADTTPLPALTRFFTWGTQDDPMPYAPPRNLAPRTAPPAVPDVAPLPNPHGDQKPRRRLTPLLIAASAATLIGLTTWALRGHDDNPTTTATPETTTPTPEPAAPNPGLTALLPPDYRTGACQPTQPPLGATAKAECKLTTAVVHYTLFSDAQKLQAALQHLIDTTTIQLCPGNYMSPGPWRRPPNREIAAGTLVCGTQNNHPTVAWTADQDLLLAVITSTSDLTALTDLYTWWTTHA